MRKTLFKSSSVLYNELVRKTRCAACQNETYTNWKRICFCILDGADKKRIPENLTEHCGGFYHEKDFAQIVLKAATVACALTALTACGGGDESAAVSVAKDENGAYVDTLTITLGRFAEPSAAALFPEGQTFEDNAYTRYIESKLNVDHGGQL